MCVTKTTIVTKDKVGRAKKRSKAGKRVSTEKVKKMHKQDWMKNYTLVSKEMKEQSKLKLVVNQCEKWT